MKTFCVGPLSYLKQLCWLTQCETNLYQ